MRVRLLLALLVSTSVHAGVRFVTPQNGSQAIGTQIVEVEADAKNIDRVEFDVDGVLAGVARTAPYRIAYDFGTSLAPRTVRARVFSDGFRTTETAEVVTASLTAGESMNVDLVEVPVRVRSRRAITASDVALRENGVAQSIRDVIAVRPPAHFAFVVDRSLSMDDGRLDAALRAVDAARASLRPGDSASLVLFNHHVARPLTLNASAIASLRGTTPTRPFHSGRT